jgi:hypothetical protein
MESSVDDAYVLYAPSSEHAMLIQNNHSNVIVVQANTTCRFRHRGKNSGPLYDDLANVCGGAGWEMTKNSLWYKIESPQSAQPQSPPGVRQFLIVELLGVPTYLTLFRPVNQGEECLSVIGTGYGGYPDQVFEWRAQNDSMTSRPFYLRVSPVFRRYRGVFDITIESYPCDENGGEPTSRPVEPPLNEESTLPPIPFPVPAPRTNSAPIPTMNGADTNAEQQDRDAMISSLITVVVALSAFVLVTTCAVSVALWWARRQKQKRRLDDTVDLNKHNAAPSIIERTFLPQEPDHGDSWLLNNEQPLPLVAVVTRSNMGNNDDNREVDSEEDDDDGEEDIEESDDVQALIEAALTGVQDLNRLSPILEGSIDDSSCPSGRDLVAAAAALEAALEWT